MSTLYLAPSAVLSKFRTHKLTSALLTTWSVQFGAKRLSELLQHCCETLALSDVQCAHLMQLFVAANLRPSPHCVQYCIKHGLTATVYQSLRSATAADWCDPLGERPYADDKIPYDDETFDESLFFHLCHGLPRLSCLNGKQVHTDFLPLLLLVLDRCRPQLFDPTQDFEVSVTAANKLFAHEVSIFFLVVWFTTFKKDHRCLFQWSSFNGTQTTQIKVPLLDLLLLTLDFQKLWVDFPASTPYDQQFQAPVIPWCPTCLPFPTRQALMETLQQRHVRAQQLQRRFCLPRPFTCRNMAGYFRKNPQFVLELLTL